MVAWRKGVGMKWLQWSRRMEHSIFIGMVITEVCTPSSKLDYTLNMYILLHVNYALLNFLNAKVDNKGYILVQMWSWFNPEKRPFIFKCGLSMLFWRSTFSSCNVSISSSNSGLSTGILVMTLSHIKIGISLIDTAL